MSKPKWKKTKTQFLLRNELSGRYYARFYRDGKQLWKALDTDVLSVAQARLSEEKKLVDQSTRLDTSSAKATFGDVVQLYLESVKRDRSIKPSMLRYRLQCVDAILRFGPDLVSSAP